MKHFKQHTSSTNGIFFLYRSGDLGDVVNIKVEYRKTWGAVIVRAFVSNLRAAASDGVVMEYVAMNTPQANLLAVKAARRSDKKTADVAARVDSIVPALVAEFEAKNHQGLVNAVEALGLSV